MSVKTSLDWSAISVEKKDGMGKWDAVAKDVRVWQGEHDAGDLVHNYRVFCGLDAKYSYNMRENRLFSCIVFRIDVILQRNYEYKYMT